MNNIAITNNLLLAINASFREPKNKKVKTRPRRIKFGGRFIMTDSGKTVWRNIGHARLAFINHLRGNDSVCLSIQEEVLGIKDKYSYRGASILKDVIKQLEKDVVLQFVEVDIEEFATEKRY